MLSPRNPWVPLIAAALLLRLFVGFVLLGGMPLVSDAGAYADQAELIARGLSHPAYYWPPGVSYYLAPFYWLAGDSVEVSRMAQVLLGTLTPVLVVLLTRRISDDPWASWSAGWIAALYPALVLHAGQPFSYELTLIGVTGCALALLEAHRRKSMALYALAGMCLAVAALARPGSLSLLLVLLPVGVWLALRNGDGRKALVLGSVVALSLLSVLLFPAALHNAEADEGWVLSTNNEKNFWFGNNPHTPHYLTAELGQRPESEMEPEVREYVRSFKERPDSREAMRAEALSYIRERPEVFALRTTNRLRAFWGFEYSFSRNIQDHFGWGLIQASPIYLYEAGGYLIMIALALAAFFSTPRLLAAPAARFCLALVLAYMLPHLLAFSAGIWHVPALGLLIPFAGVGLSNLRGPEKRAHLARSRAFWAALGGVVLIQAEYAYFVIQYAS